MASTPPAQPVGLLVVDKPAGLTSHQVVARVRRILGTRKVGHAGTLDPMATGVLVIGVGRATKLLGYVAGDNKTYLATIRLGVGTNTEDAEGEVTKTPGTELDPGARSADLTLLQEAMAGLTGKISQMPSAVSAIKVDGKRAYARVRAGEDVQLKPRPVTISRFELVGSPRTQESQGVRILDLDVEVDCSTGTYVRALARDLGVALGTAAHLTSLRRTRVGSWTLESALTLEQLQERVADGTEVLVPLGEAVLEQFPTLLVTERGAKGFAHGLRLRLSEALADPRQVKALEGGSPDRVYALAADADPLKPFGLARVQNDRLTAVLHLFPGGH